MPDLFSCAAWRVTYLTGLGDNVTLKYINYLLHTILILNIIFFLTVKRTFGLPQLTSAILTRFRNPFMSQVQYVTALTSSHYVWVVGMEAVCK